MTPKKFLMLGGWVLLIVGILGFLLPGGRVLGDTLWFDSAENWAHTILGIVALILAYWAPQSTHKPITILVGLVALFFAITGFAVSGKAVPNWYGLTNLENPLDNIIHLVIGVWGLWAGFKKA